LQNRNPRQAQREHDSDKQNKALDASFHDPFTPGW